MNIQLENATVLSNTSKTEEYYLLKIAAPHIAATAQPGQFIHLKLPDRTEMLLRRPFSIFNTQEHTLSILYKVVGKGTRHMESLFPGQVINVMGPLGNGFPHPNPNKESVLIAGGYGMAALYLTAKHAEKPGILFAGGARQQDILCADDFTRLGWDVHIATEDGSLGACGLVTGILDQWYATRTTSGDPEFFSCGPMGMLKAVSARALQWNCRAWVSLDHYMACGVGACLACVHKIKKNGEEKLACTCKEGPVFESREIVWESAT